MSEKLSVMTWTGLITKYLRCSGKGEVRKVTHRKSCLKQIPHILLVTLSMARF